MNNKQITVNGYTFQVESTLGRCIFFIDMERTNAGVGAFKPLHFHGIHNQRHDDQDYGMRD